MILTAQLGVTELIGRVCLRDYLSDFLNDKRNPPSSSGCICR